MGAVGGGGSGTGGLEGRLRIDDGVHRFFGLEVHCWGVAESVVGVLGGV